jgi:iron(III) transport system permease protein
MLDETPRPPQSSIQHRVSSHPAVPKTASRFWFPLLLGAIATAGMATLWLTEPRVARLWLNTAWLAGGAILVALPLGTAAAVAILKTDVPGRGPAAILLAAMLFVPLYLVTGAWDAGFGIQGWHTLAMNPHLASEPWLAGWRAAIWVHGLAAVPWVALIVGAGLRAVEAELEEDALTCTSPAHVLWHVTLPRASAAIMMAALWVAIVASVEISVTDFFQVRTFAEEVYTQSALGTFDVSGEPGAGSSEQAAIDGSPLLGASGLFLGLVLSTLLALIAIVAAGRLFAYLADAMHRPTWIWRLHRGRRPAAIALWSILFLVAAVPLANLLYKAGVLVTTTDAGRVRSWSVAKVGERIVAAPQEFAGELLLSGTIGANAATAALAIGLPLAWSMRLARRTPWLRLTALALCLTIPGPLLGVALIRLLNRPPDSPLAFLELAYDSNIAPWLVQTIRALPIVTLILWSALATIPQVMLDAATMDGAGWWGRLVRIALPQRWPAAAAAWLIGLAIAVGELAATVLVIPPQPYTAISVRVFQLLHYGVDDRVAAICLVMVAGIATLTGIAAALLKRRM